jgi:peroxiredoxin
MKASFFRPIIFFTILVLSGSCTAKAQSSSSAGISKAFNEAGLKLLKEGIAPRDFTLPALTGESVSLSNYKGQVVFLNFWATWCGPCRNEMPSMESLYNRYKDKGLRMLAVNGGESRKQVIDFMEANSLTFPALLDENGKVHSSYGIQSIPRTCIIDKEGKIILRIVGSINWDTPKIHAAIESLLNL